MMTAKEFRSVPTKIEKDDITGIVTTGHEWDGLKELNRPLPKWWLYILYATIVFAAVWMVLYPSVPGITGYFHGILGYSQRQEVNREVAAVQAIRAADMAKINAMSFDAIRKDPQLLAVAQTAGRITFANTELAGTMDHKTAILEAHRAVGQILDRVLT